MRGSHELMIRGMIALGACLLVTGCPLAQGPDDGGDTESKLAVFGDPDSDFSTTDVYDVEDEIIQFNTENDSIIWKTDGSEYDQGQWAVEGNFPDAAKFFQIRFGTVSGERRAYLTETVRATICDVRISGEMLQVFASNVTVPQE